MSSPYVGEIRMFAGNFAPVGWAFADGQLIPIAENDVLFQLYGTTYGGDGQTTFALPDLRGRLPLHQGNGFILGQNGGVEQVTLTAAQIPQHIHPMLASSDPSSGKGALNLVLGRSPAEAYASEFTPQALSAQSTSSVGGSQPHTNFQPYLCINFIVSLFGIFPPPS
jgi:microcystin-dependent protein